MCRNKTKPNHTEMSDLVLGKLDLLAVVNWNIFQTENNYYPTETDMLLPKPVSYCARFWFVLLS